MDTRGLEEALFAPVADARGPMELVFGLADGGALTNDAVSRIEELAALLGIAFHHHFGLRETSRKIEKLEANIRESHSFHSEVSGIIQHVLAGKSLHELIRRLAQQDNAPLLVEDSSYGMLSFAWPSGAPNISFDAHEHVLLSLPLQEPAARSELHNAAADGEPRYFKLPEAFPYAAARVTVPLVIEGAIVGYLSNLRNSRESNAEADRRLSLAAGFVGLHMIRRQTAGEVRQRLSGELVNELIGGSHDESVISRLQRLGYNLTPPVYIVVLGWERGQRKQPSKSDPTIKMVMGTVADVLSRQYPGALIGEKEDLVLFAISVEEERTVVEVANQAITAVQEAFPGTVASACVSRRCAQSWDMEAAYLEASKALRLHDNFGRESGVVSASALGSYTALLQTDNLKGLHEFATRWLQPLRAYDAEKDGELVKTLHAYLRHWGHQSKTAAECSVHVSTLKYRLRRIEEIGGINLSDEETRTQAQLACHILRAIDILHANNH